MRLSEFFLSSPRYHAEWDWDKNTADPDSFSVSSSEKAWWKCECGHSWQANITSRVARGRDCPYCAGKLPVAGKTDLKSKYPKIAAQWHPSKNNGLLPEQVMPGSDRSVWWRCDLGHEWKSNIGSRTRDGRGCPYCAGQRVIPGETDLATKYPLVAERWHQTKNGKTTPQQIMPNTHKRFWWQCEKGHEWLVAPTALVQGSGCPYCAGKKVIPGETDLCTVAPELARQWHPTKNKKLRPEQVSAGSEKTVWWLCDLGHDYKSHIFSRAQGTGCPYCAGRKAWPGFNDLGTLFPELAKQWHSTLNGALTPQDVTKGSHRSIWWECSQGHVWKAVVFARTRKRSSGCPVCAGKVKMKTK